MEIPGATTRYERGVMNEATVRAVDMSSLHGSQNLDECLLVQRPGCASNSAPIHPITT